MAEEVDLFILPINVADILSSAFVQEMQDSQFRWYFRLLCFAWMNKKKRCHLPNDDEKLRIYAGCRDKKKWGRLKELVLSNFEVTSDQKFIFNARLVQEKETILELKQKRADAGRKGADTRWQSHSKAIPEPKQEIAPTPTPTPINPKSKPSATRADSRHFATQRFIERCCKHANVPFIWEASEGKILSSWLKAAGDISQAAIEQLVRNRFRSKDPPGQRPRVWIPQLSSYTTPLNEFNKPENGNGTSKAQQRNIGNFTNIAEGFGVHPNADTGGGELEDHSDSGDGLTLEGSTKPV